MYQIKLFSVIVVFMVIVLLSFQQIEAKPLRILSRSKRISDQRLAELETLIALAKMKGKMVTIPVGFGRLDLDPNKLGRKRRSVEKLFKELINDLSSQEEDGKTEEEEEEEEEEEKQNFYDKLLYSNSKLIRTNNLPE